MRFAGGTKCFCAYLRFSLRRNERLSRQPLGPGPISWPIKSISEDTIKRAKRVLKSDFLTLSISPRLIGYPNFVDPWRGPKVRNFGRYFWFEAEAVLIDIDGLYDFLAKDLITALHVCEVKVRCHIGHQCQYAVSNTVPEIQNAMTFPAGES